MMGAKEIYKFITIFLMVSALASCQARNAEENNSGTKQAPSKKTPTKNEVIAAAAPHYQSPEGVRSECLARLTFDVSHTVNWPIARAQSNSSNIYSPQFSANVAVDGGVSLRYSNVDIFVIDAPNERIREQVLFHLPRVSEKFRRSAIAERRATIAELQSDDKTSPMERAYIRDSEELIGSWQKNIEALKANFENFDPMVAGGEGYWKKTVLAQTEYSNYRAYIQRGNLIYIFETLKEIVNNSVKQTHKQEFLKILANFKERAPYEIPTGPGVCFPYGFIKDDGRTSVEFRHAFRFNDAPGVLYTIDTGTVNDRNIKWPMATALARASMNSPSQPEDREQGAIKQRIRPLSYRIGGLTGIQGGVVLEITAPGASPYEVYSVFTGYSGHMGSVVLPYILVDMRTVHSNKAPELTENPPAFVASMQRLDLILKSMRWRPTKPPMPEFNTH